MSRLDELVTAALAQGPDDGPLDELVTAALAEAACAALDPADRARAASDLRRLLDALPPPRPSDRALRRRLGAAADLLDTTPARSP